MTAHVLGEMNEDVHEDVMKSCFVSHGTCKPFQATAHGAQEHMLVQAQAHMLLSWRI